MRAKRKELPTNRWSRSSEKEQYWRLHLKSWVASGLSVRAYCQENGVVETSFYAWRRELGIRDREQLNGAKGDARKATVKDSRGRTIPLQCRETVPIISDSQDIPENKQRTPFVRLNIVDDKMDEESAKEPAPAVATKPIGLTITTPNGYLISLNQITDIDLISDVVAKLEGRKC